MDTVRVDLHSAQVAPLTLLESNDASSPGEIGYEQVDQVHPPPQNMPNVEVAFEKEEIALTSMPIKTTFVVTFEEVEEEYTTPRNMPNLDESFEKAEEDPTPTLSKRHKVIVRQVCHDENPLVCGDISVRTKPTKKAPKPPPTAQCHSCGKWFKNMGSLSKHMSVAHAGTDQDIAKVKCKWCDKMISINNRHAHKMSARHLANREICRSAKLQSSVSNKQLPTKEASNSPPSALCDYCGKSFKSNGSLKKHKSVVHAGPSGDQSRAECKACQKMISINNWHCHQLTARHIENCKKKIAIFKKST